MEHTEMIDNLDAIPFELRGLDKAIRYQQWVMEAIRPFLGKRILELGSGIGNMSRWFTNTERLILTEYDHKLLEILSAQLPHWFSDTSHISISPIDLKQKNLSAFENEHLDTIVSFNVLEHIEDDLSVLQDGINLLRQSQAQGKKRFIHFVPAHQWAYGKMDKKFEHYRRYTKKRFIELHQQSAPDAKLILKPFNFVGLWGWFVNGRVLKKDNAGPNVIATFETLCPIFKKMDRLLINYLGIPLGQSLIAIQELPN